jgi:carbon monoxide dehydrogenase subunit G
VASFSHAVEIARPPAEVFPWLLAEDRVPRWTSHLEAYERLGDGPLGPGARLRQVLDVSGRRIDVALEVVGYDAPRAAETRFSTNGIDVASRYALEPAGAGTRLTQTIEAKAGSFGARMLLPVLQPRLEQKVREDLGRLRDALSG